MDPSAGLHDARKQIYFLPGSNDNIAFQTKSPISNYADVQHGTIDVTDPLADILLDTSTTPAILEASVIDAQRPGLTMPSAEPVLVASPTASESDSSMLAPPESNSKSSALPSKSILERAADLTIDDARGQAVPFKELYRAEPGQRRHVMIIFIRHFFCGVSPRGPVSAISTNRACLYQNCQEFLRTLIAQIPATSLPASTSIAIIGCGSHTLIPSYTELTSCPYPIYADPTTRLFNLLGMKRTLSLGWKAPDYIHHTLAAGVVKSIVQGVKRIPAGDVTKAGDLSQNGGEYLLEVEGVDTRSTQEEHGHNEKGNTGLKVKVAFCHRMRNSRDHTEIPRLIELLGLSDNNERSRRPSSRLDRRWTSGETIGNLARSLSNRRQSWLERRNSSSLSRTRKRDRSESSNAGDTARRSPERIETVREDVRIRK
jgi:hypothetical protein